MTDPRTVVLVDDHALVREGLRRVLEKHADLKVVGEAATVVEAVAVIEESEPDIVLLDMRLGDEEGGEVARRLRAAGQGVKILVLSAHDTSRHLRDALAAGADGYLLKSVTGDALAAGIRNVLAGQTVIGHEFVSKLLDETVHGTGPDRSQITGREHEVLELVAEGLGNRELAERLGISTRTAQKHVENLFKKVGVHDRTELVARAFRQGLLG